MPPDGKTYKKLSAFNTNATPESTDLLVSISSTGENQNVPISSVHKVDSVNGMTGAVVLDPSDIGADALGSAAQALVDSKIYTDSEITAIDTGVQSVVAGTGIAVDATDPANPIVTNTQTSAEWGNITGTLSSQTDLNNALGGKVDKVTGKQLSTNDYTNLEKIKLSGIEDEAEKNVNSDWNAVSGDAQILNKPTIPTKTSDITNDSGFITTEADPTVPAWAKTPSKPTYTKADVGLGNVDNTSDLSKPVSTATQSALDGKQATLVSGTNIKTINGSTLLGSGDLTISGGGGSSLNLYPKVPSGRWLHGMSAGYVTNQAPSSGYVPILVARDMTIDAGGTNINTSSASSTVKMALYSDDGTGYPGAKVADFGTIDSSTTGQKIQTLGTNVDLTAGLHWILTIPSDNVMRLPVTAHTAWGEPQSLWHGSAIGANTTVYHGGYITTDTAPPATAPSGMSLNRYIAIGSIRAA